MKFFMSLFHFNFLIFNKNYLSFCEIINSHYPFYVYSYYKTNNKFVPIYKLFYFNIHSFLFLSHSPFIEVFKHTTGRNPSSATL